MLVLQDDRSMHCVYYSINCGGEGRCTIQLSGWGLSSLFIAAAAKLFQAGGGVHAMPFYMRL
jgi:hypothetical protein